MKSNTKRLQIINVAKSCFAQFGYDKTTLDDIGKRMGMNKSSLYYYFNNKEEIFTAVVIEEADGIVNSLQAEMQDRNSPEEKIQYYMKMRLGYYRKVLSLHQLSAESLRQIQPGFHQLYNTILEREITFIQKQLEQIDENVNETLARRIAELIITSADGIKHDEILYNNLDTFKDPNYVKIETDTEFLISLVLKGVRANVHSNQYSLQ
jgi:AcrR family transcriptional regulator